MTYDASVKRHVITLALFLLLGAVVNVAVAWACRLWTMPIHHGELPLSEAHREWARSWGEEADPDWNVQTARSLGRRYGGPSRKKPAYEHLDGPHCSRLVPIEARLVTHELANRRFHPLDPGTTHLITSNRSDSTKLERSFHLSQAELFRN